MEPAGRESADFERGQASDVQEALVSGIIHDLANVLLPAEFLVLHVRDRLPAQSDLRGQLGAVGEAIARAGALSNKLLRYVGVSTGAAITIELGPLLRDAVRLLEASHEADVSRGEGGESKADATPKSHSTKGFQLELPKTPVWVCASPPALLQLLCTLGRLAGTIRQAAEIPSPTGVRIRSFQSAMAWAECQFVIEGNVVTETLHAVRCALQSDDLRGLRGDYRVWRRHAHECGGRLSVRRERGETGTPQRLLCTLILPQKRGMGPG